MRKLLAGAAIASAMFVGSAAAVQAGEITGNGKITPIEARGVAASECAYSGLEDDPQSPGVTQTPGKSLKGLAGGPVPGLIGAIVSGSCAGN